MTYEEGYWSLVVERSSLKAKNKVLLATLQKITAAVSEPFDGSTNFSSDKLKAIDKLANEAITKVRGGA